MQFQKCLLLYSYKFYVWIILPIKLTFLILLDILFAVVQPVVLSKLDYVRHFHDPVGYYFTEMTFTV